MASRPFMRHSRGGNGAEQPIGNNRSLFSQPQIAPRSRDVRPSQAVKRLDCVVSSPAMVAPGGKLKPAARSDQHNEPIESSPVGVHISPDVLAITTGTKRGSG